MSPDPLIRGDNDGRDTSPGYAPTFSNEPGSDVNNNPAQPQAGAQRPKGTWRSSGFRRTDAQAHRDHRYHIKSPIIQTISVFKTQMSLYSKRKSIYVLLVMAILIPLIYVALKDQIPITNLTENSGNGVMGLLLFLFPLILGLFSAFLCGRSMPSEFVERSAYMNMALPMSRASFCIGKYLAAYVVSLGVFVFAYGMALAGSMIEYKYYDESSLGTGFILVMLALLVFTSFSFSLGCILKRGATILSILTMFAIMPGIELYLLANDYISNTDLLYLPNIFPDMVSLSLGCPLVASPFGMLNMILPVVDVSEIPMMTIAIITIVWTLGFLTLGVIATKRREM